MTDSDYREGDFAYCEFEIVQVKKVENGHVNVVDFGNICMSGRNIEEQMVPLTLDNKLVSEEFHRIYCELHEKGSSGLNYPQFKPYLVNLWYSACLDCDSKSVDEIIDTARTFLDTVLDLQKNTMVAGMRLMR